MKSWCEFIVLNSIIFECNTHIIIEIIQFHWPVSHGINEPNRSNTAKFPTSKTFYYMMASLLILPFLSEWKIWNQTYDKNV